MDDTARGWMSLEAAARYANVRRERLQQAICAGELDAYELPGERGRVFLRLHAQDVDAWIRRTWRKAGPDTWGKGRTRCA